MSQFKLINTELLNQVSEQAKKTERQRMNYNFHEDFNDPLQRMLNALEPDTYLTPHKHENPDKDEIFIIMKGSVGILSFDNEGNVTNTYRLSKESEILGIDIPAKQWHTVISLEPGTVIYEIKKGPYVKASEANFAPWAPKEGTQEAKEYLEKLRAFFK